MPRSTLTRPRVPGYENSAGLVEGWKGARCLGLHLGPPRRACLGKTLKTLASLSSPICYVRI